MPVSSSVWNKLILPHSSPSERFDRAGQLANLLKTSESDVQVDLRLDSDVQVDLRSDDANEAENKKLCSILKKAGRKTPGFVPPTGIELNRNSLPNKPKFPFLRKGHSLTKYKSSKMKNPERCLGVRGLINENVQFNDNKSKPVHRDVKIDSEQPDEVFQSLHSDLNTNFDPAGQIIHPKPILPTSIKNNYISDPSLDEHSLREFEFLERAAEQTSFISSSSIVSQALQINPFDLKKDERLSNISERCENEDDMRITEDQKTSLAEMDEGNLMKSSFPTKFPSTEDSIDLSLGNIDFLDESSWLSTKRHSGFSSSASLSLSREDFCPKSPSLSQSTNCISPKFINRYFSKFRPEADEIIPTAEKNTGDAEILNESTLGNHLIELQKEIERFRQENLQLTNLRNQQKIYQKQLEQEKKAFEVYKQQETERITKYLESEKQKTRKERELYDAYLKTRPQFDKQERKELLKLKTEVKRK
uniref:Uncharacterized protein n=1 Tax=Strigamia maritima TaxID=126957 RepID=T1ITY1_STRMM